MKSLARTLFVATALLFAAVSAAQDGARSDADELKIAAMEALISAPADRALPIVKKVLAGNDSDELKEGAFFILSQIDAPEAHAILLEFATKSGGELQFEAIRMIGIGGDEDALANLKGIYDAGNTEAREAVLEALMIAGHKQAVYEIAMTAQGEDYEEAVDMLSVMGARAELRELASSRGTSEALIDAYAISGDFESLQKLAVDTSDPELQEQAIEAMGIIGGDEVDATLLQIYREANSEDIREAALDGMMISGNDKGMLELYRSSDDPALKKELLQYLVVMGSDEVWDIIDSALAGDQ